MGEDGASEVPVDLDLAVVLVVGKIDGFGGGSGSEKGEA